MRKFIATLAAVALVLALAPSSEAAGPARFGVGVGLQRARVINPGVRNVAAFRAVNAVRGLALGLGGFGYNRSLGLGLGGYGHSAAFVQPVYAQPFVQSYSLVQPVQAFTQVQAVVAQPVIHQQVYSQALGVDHCNVQALGIGGCGYGAQAILGGVGGYGLGFRQPLLRQRFIAPRIQGFRY